MRLAPIFTLAFTLSVSVWALPTLPLTFNDALNSTTPGDVVGDPAKFEIYNLTFASFTPATNTLQVDIRFNYGGGSSLAPFNIGGGFPTLNVGDLFLRTASNTYAFVLTGHNGLSAGSLYQVTGTQTAAQVLGNPGGSYRPDAIVWASGTGASLVNAGSILVNTVGGVDTQLLTSLNLVLSNAVLNDLNNGFNFSFASATCGNDLIEGSVPGIPEPGTWTLLGAGLVGLGLLGRKR